MDLVTGALGLLPSKLLELLKDEYKLQKGVKVQVQSLSKELESMHAALRKVAAVPLDQLDEQVKVWAREVREASYDMEDILDALLVRVDGHDQPDPNKLNRTMKKMTGLFKKGKARHDISSAIEDIRRQLQEVAERRARYRVDELVAKPAATTSIDPRLSALHTKVSELVGIEEPREKLIKMLTSIEGNMETKIVCIVGFGGLGKTTLAKAVYENLSQDVRYKAFVRVGRNPDLNTVLKDILIDLDKQRYTKEFNLTLLNERQLIDELRDFLNDKRFFIIIYDIWDVPSWNIIRCALDNTNLGSKIVVTSRKHDVAEKVGYSYNMEPLPHESSKVLFYRRIFDCEGKCPKQFVEVSEKIIKKCGGVPLAIITTSGLLVNKLANIKEWYEYCDSIGSGLGSNPDMENMRKILSLSYYDLPFHLKTCLLYLSVFPEDYKIYKDQLIWRWIAEDFVSPGEGSRSLFELGESYFNDLVNRSLIQPTNMNSEGLPTACRVHDMVLDLICSISGKESFVATILGNAKQNTPFCGSKARRLSLQNSTWPTIMDMSKLRSVTIFGDAIIKFMPSLSSFHLLRVLDIEGCSLEEHTELSFVAHLFHLRYLGLRNTGYAGQLPLEIGKLHLLQTLDLYRTEIKELPSTIVGLRKLMCLFLNWSICPPNGLRNMTSLEEICAAVVYSGHIVEEIGHLTQLRVLTAEVKMDKEAECAKSVGKTLLGSLGKLYKIQKVTVISVDAVMDLDGSVESLGNLSYLGIHKITLLPEWINPGWLCLLFYLEITVTKVRREDIQVLGMLQALRILSVMALAVGNRQVLGRFMVAPDAFPYTVQCRFAGFHTVPSMFPRGAMPRLEDFNFNISHQDFFQGQFTTDDQLALDHHPSLRSMSVGLHGGKEKIEQELKMKLNEKLRQEADGHPNNPSFNCFLY